MKYTDSHQILALEVLKQLQKDHSLSSLRPFWTRMSPDEREQFASVLFDEGKQLILKGQPYAFHCLDLSRRIAPFCAKLQFKQAVFLLNYALKQSSEKYLLLAEKHIQHAIEIKSKFFDAWYIWGDILVHLGLVYKESSYFQKAHEKYAKAADLSQDNPKYLKKFLWDWALCWFFLGKHSGEAIDIKKALEKFEETSRLGCNEPAFWRDFGNAWSEMGLLIRDVRFLEKANTYYDKAIQLNPRYFEGWLSLAHSHQHLYLHKRKENDLAHSHAAYGKASEIKSEDLDLWISWGNLFLASGRTKGEIKHLQMSAMKYAKALKINPDHSEALSLWGEALTILGTFTGRLDHLKEAEKKVNQALESARECPDVWYRLGFCLYAQGQYFEDGDYFLLAIEKFKQALKLDRHHFYALNGMGLAQFSLGDMHQDLSLLEQSSSYFDLASQIRKNHPELWNNWGMTLMRLADINDSQELIESAIEKYEQALQLYQDSTPSTQLLYNYACALDFLGGFTEEGQNYEKAANLLELVLKKDPDFTPVYYNLALVYAHLAELLDDTDYYNQSNDAFYKASKEDPEDEMIWNTWGVTLTQYAKLIYEPLKVDLYEGLIKEAEKKLRQALALGSLDALYNLACLHCLAGNLNEALHYLQLAYQKEALPSLEQLLYDDSLEALRQSELFQHFLHEQLLKDQAKDN